MKNGVHIEVKEAATSATSVGKARRTTEGSENTNETLYKDAGRGNSVKGMRTFPARTSPEGVEYGEGTYGDLALLWKAPHLRCVVGKYCSIAQGATAMLASEHRADWVTTYPFSAFGWYDNSAPVAVGKGDIVIGNDVWLGWQCLVLSGVKIGHGAVVGARAVVTKDVPPYAVVGGVPARVIKMRFPPPVIERLLRVCWWDWPQEKLRTFMPLLQGDDSMERFLIAAESDAQTEPEEQQPQ